MPIHYLDLWDSNEKREQELKKRLEFAKLARRKEEAQWEQNERAVFASRFEEFFTGFHGASWDSDDAGGCF